MHPPFMSLYQSLGYRLRCKRVRLYKNFLLCLA